MEKFGNFMHFILAACLLQFRRYLVEAEPFSRLPESSSLTMLGSHHAMPSPPVNHSLLLFSIILVAK